MGEARRPRGAGASGLTSETTPLKVVGPVWHPSSFQSPSLQVDVSLWLISVCCWSLLSPSRHKARSKWDDKSSVSRAM